MEQNLTELRSNFSSYTDSIDEGLKERNTTFRIFKNILEKLCDEGSMIETKSKQYKFTNTGLKHAGKLFVETFQEMQQPGHYECHDGCCEGDDHSKCKHN